MAAPTCLGPYEITEVLFAGRTGSVYAGYGPGFRKVAVKTLEPIYFSAGKNSMGERFLRGVRAAMTAKSAHVVRILDSGIDAATKQLWCAMEFVDGMPLKDLLEQKKTFEPAQAVDLTLQIAHGVEALHAQRVVHRNIKPANILVSSGMRATLSGMSLVKLLERGADEITETGAVMGTPAYLAPEALTDSSRIDQRADIFSLAVVLYEMLRGTLPYEGRTVMDQLLGKMGGPPAIDSPPLLAPLIQKMLHPDREQRPRSMGHVIAELTELRKRM